MPFTVIAEVGSGHYVGHVGGTEVWRRRKEANIALKALEGKGGPEVVWQVVGVSRSVFGRQWLLTNKKGDIYA